MDFLRNIYNIFFKSIFIVFIHFLANSESISDFEIEGMTVGQSALEYFSKKDLNEKKIYHWYDTSKYTPIDDINYQLAETYDTFQISIFTNDEKFIMQGISGFIFYENINDCYKEIDSISKDIKSLFINIKDHGKQTYAHGYDKTGNTKITDRMFELDDGVISIQCTDWSDTFEYKDSLKINIDTLNYIEFLSNDIYQ